MAELSEMQVVIVSVCVALELFVGVVGYLYLIPKFDLENENEDDDDEANGGDDASVGSGQTDGTPPWASLNQRPPNPHLPPTPKQFQAKAGGHRQYASLPYIPTVFKTRK
jgi:hypothetical protein